MNQYCPMFPDSQVLPDEAGLCSLCGTHSADSGIEDYVLKLLDDMENDDENIDTLQKAAEFYCGNYDLCEGYKHALRMTIHDQYTNHPDEQDPQDLAKIITILE